MTTTLARNLLVLSDDDIWRSSVPASREAVLSDDDSYESSSPLAVELVVRCKDEIPAWLEPTTRVLEQLLGLEPNWDSCGALRVDAKHALGALQLLELVLSDQTPSPQLVPTNRGGVQIEWHLSGIDLEIETLSSNRFLVFYEDLTRGEEDEWEQDLNSDSSRLLDVILRITSNGSHQTV